MKARGFVALCMGAALVAGACGGAENDSTLDPVDSPPASDTARPSGNTATDMNRGAEQTISGSLGKVDPDARIFTLTAEGRDQTFRFNDATDVSGMAGSQGLAGREGAHVTVYYREDGGGTMATRIVMNGSPATPSQSDR